MGLKLLASFKMTKIACCLAFCMLIYHDEVTKRKVQTFLLDRHVGVSVFELLPYNGEGNEESCKHSLSGISSCRLSFMQKLIFFFWGGGRREEMKNGNVSTCRFKIKSCILQICVSLSSDT